jgi:cell pole-organizing protein PopZ
MAGETSQEEPSMEEILASIRRIISEDGEEEEKPDAAQSSAEGDSNPEAGEVPAEAQLADTAKLTGASDEVLELTDEVDEHGNVVEAQAPDQAEPAVEAAEIAEVSELAAEPEAAPEPEPISELAAESAAQSTAAQQVMENDEPLIETLTEESTAGAFAALASQIGAGSADENGQKITPSGLTIEDHVLEMLRPMIREWLDKHLPQMVQRLVQREIDRIIHRSDPV